MVKKKYKRHKRKTLIITPKEKTESLPLRSSISQMKTLKCSN